MADSSDSLAASGPDGDRSGRPGWLRGVLGWSDPYRGRPARQYMRTLQSAYLAIKARSPELPEVIAKDLEAAFRRWDGDGANWASAEAWDDAFRCERLMVNLYDPVRLEVLLERRIVEARGQGLAVAEFYRGRVGGPDQKPLPERVELNRALLAGLTDDLQWHYSQRDLKRSYAHQAQKRVFWTFLVCLAIFALVMWRTFDFAGG